MIQPPMPELPQVAIITRTRDRPVFLKRAIRSVLAQTYTDWVHVIVNDGGERTALETVTDPHRTAYDKRLQVIHQENMGMQTAANIGIAQSQSTYLVIHDDDDSWHPDFLKETVGFLEAKGPENPYQGVISETMRILEKMDPEGSLVEASRAPYVPLREVNLFRVGYENPFPPIAFLYRRAVHDHIGFFDPQWDLVADLDFNFRFLRSYEIGVIPRPLAYYHWRSDDSADSTAANSVTLRAAEHGRRLNELKNHYLREATTANEAAVALGFQIAAFAVENQWMTADIRDRSIESLHHLSGMAQQIRSLQQQSDGLSHLFHNALWPKIGEDIPTLLNTLHQELKDRSDAATHLQNTLVNAAREQSVHLDKIGSILTEGLWPKIAEEIPSLLNTVLSLAEQQAGHNLRGFEAAAKAIAHLNASVSSTFTLLEATHAAQKHQAEVIENELSALRNMQSAIAERNTAMERRLQELTDQKTLLQIGPLQLQWKRATKSKED